MVDLGFESDEQPLESLQYEDFKNVLAKPRDLNYLFFLDSFGKDNVIENGYAQRTKHEVNSGLRSVEKRKIHIEAEIVNLPFTVVNARSMPAKTAFTTRPIEQRKIYLVPDHTPTRILKDKSFHKDGLKGALLQREISKETYELFIRKMDRLDVGERVAASIIHEYGHILTYNAFDKLNLTKPTEVYEWLDETGYLDNCSKRMAGFSESSAQTKINAALEQLAEDYRISHDIYNGYGLSPLPHCLSYVQDAKDNETFLKGVDIMTRVLLLDEKKKKVSTIGSKSALDYIVPFGEADRSPLSKSFTQGHITPITMEIKQKDIESLKEFEDSFEDFI